MEASQVTESVLSSSDFYLCNLFGDDSRFVDFINMTGRHIRLAGRLELESLSSMAWTTEVIIAPRDLHVWRFLGGRREDDLSLLSLLPDPYFLAKENSFTWTASFVDSSEEESLVFGESPDQLQLQSLPTLEPNQRHKINIRRQSSPVSSLRKLASDSLVLQKNASTDHLLSLNIPRWVFMN